MWSVLYGIGMFGLGIITGWCASRSFEYGSLTKEWDKLTEQYGSLTKERNKITEHYKKLEEHKTFIENYKKSLERKNGGV